MEKTKELTTQEREIIATLFDLNVGNAVNIEELKAKIKEYGNIFGVTISSANVAKVAPTVKKNRNIDLTKKLISGRLPAIGGLQELYNSI